MIPYSTVGRRVILRFPFARQAPEPFTRNGEERNLRQFGIVLALPGIEEKWASEEVEKMALELLSSAS